MRRESYRRFFFIRMAMMMVAMTKRKLIFGHVCIIFFLYVIVFEMAHKGVLMSIESDKTATPYPAETARRFFREIVLGIEYCKLFFIITKK